MVASCFQKHIGNNTTPLKTVVTTATEWNKFFTRYNAMEWVAGDIAYDIQLPNYTILWCFGDSFLGPAAATGDPRPLLAPAGPIWGNTFVHQKGLTANTLFGWDSGFPVAYLRPAAADEHYWPKQGIYYNNKVYVFLYHFKSCGNMCMTFLGTKIAVLNYPDLTLSHITTIDKGSTKIMFGSSLLLQGTTLYIYGSEDNGGGTTKYMHVAKVDMSQIENGNAWKHYKNSGYWSTGISNSKRIFTNNSNEFTVFKSGTTYYLINQDGTAFSNKIYRYKSSLPQGTWENKLLIYETPYHGAGTWTYDAKAHPVIKNPSDAGSLLVHYDVNADGLGKIYANINLYRPYFVWINGWQ